MVELFDAAINGCVTLLILQTSKGVWGLEFPDRGGGV